MKIILATIILLLVHVNAFAGDSLNMWFVGNYNTPDSAHGVAVRNNVAYVADGVIGGLRIVNVVNPASPIEISNIPISGGAYNVVVRDSLAFVSALQGGLHIINIKVSTTPVEIGFFSTLNGNWIRNVFLQGKIAFVADGLGGLKIVDITNPKIPLQIGEFITSAALRDVVLKDTIAYAVTKGNLYVLNVADSTTPLLISQYPFGGDHVTIQDTFLFVNTLSTSNIYTIMNPTNITKIGQTGTYTGYGLVVNGRFLYSADDVYDLKNIQSPSLAGYYHNNYPYSVTGMACEGNLVYCTYGVNGMRILRFIPDTIPPNVQILSPSVGDHLMGSSMKMIKWLQTDNQAVHHNDLYYSQNDTSHWQMFQNWRPPDTMLPWRVPTTSAESCFIKIDAIDRTGNVGSAISGPFSIYPDAGKPVVHLISPNGGEQINGGSIFNIQFQQSDSGHIGFDSINYSVDSGANWNPVAIYSLPNTQDSGTFGQNWHVPNIAQPHCLVKVVAFDSYNNTSEDISDETFSIIADSCNMRKLGAYNYPGTGVSNVFVSGHYAYVSTADSGFIIIDVSDPVNPIRVNKLPDLPAQYVHGANNLLLVSVPDTMVAIYDITDSVHPSLVSTYGIKCRALYVRDTIAFMIRYGDWNFGGGWPYYSNMYLEAVDLGDPQAPHRISYYNYQRNIKTAYICQEHAYVYTQTTDHYGTWTRFIVNDVADPYDFSNSLYWPPSYEGYYYFTPSSISAYGDYAFLPSGSDAIVYDCSGTAAVIIDSIAFPGPLSDMKKLGRHAITCNKLGGVRLYDMQNPAAPLEIGFYQTPGKASKLFSDGHYFYIADSSSLQILQQLIDTLLPTTPQSISPSANEYLPDSLVQFAWHSASDIGSGIYRYILEWAIDQNFRRGNTIEVAETTVTLAMADTNYYWHIKSVDNWGNTGPWSQTRLFIVDSHAPSASILLAPAPDTVMPDTLVQFIWSACFKKAGSKATPVDYTLSIVGGNSLQTRDTMISLTLPQGRYFWKVGACDQTHGTNVYSESRQLIIDTQAPLIALLDSFSGTITTNERQIKIRATFTDVDTFQQPQVYWTSGVDWEHAPMQPAQGLYVGSIALPAIRWGDAVDLAYFVQVSDRVGHVATSDTFSFIVKYAPVTYQFLGSYPNPASSEVVFRYQLPEAMDVSVELYNIEGQRVRRADFGVQSQGFYRQRISIRDLAQGIYFYRFIAGANKYLQRLVVIR